MSDNERDNERDNDINNSINKLNASSNNNNNNVVDLRIKLEKTIGEIARLREKLNDQSKKVEAQDKIVDELKTQLDRLSGGYKVVMILGGITATAAAFFGNLFSGTWHR